MKTTDHFKEVIKKHLEQRVAEDALFEPKYNNPEKNLDDCITYILNEVKKSGYNGFSDEEIYSMAIHYYDEDDIEVGSPIRAKVVVNHVVELTDIEKEAAKAEAIQQYKNQVANDLKKEAEKKPKKAKKQKPVEVEQLSLF